MNGGAWELSGVMETFHFVLGHGCRDGDVKMYHFKTSRKSSPSESVSSVYATYKKSGKCYAASSQVNSAAHTDAALCASHTLTPLPGVLLEPPATPRPQCRFGVGQRRVWHRVNTFSQACGMAGAASAGLGGQRLFYAAPGLGWKPMNLYLCHSCELVCLPCCP